MVQCRIVRNKHGVDKGMFPSYYLYLEAEDGVAVRSGPSVAGRLHAGEGQMGRETSPNSEKHVTPLFEHG